MGGGGEEMEQYLYILIILAKLPPRVSAYLISHNLIYTHLSKLVVVSEGCEYNLTISLIVHSEMFSSIDKLNLQ